MISIFLLSAAVFAADSIRPAQTGDLAHGPVTGILVEDQTLRVIEGLPGAMRLSEPVEPPASTLRMWAAPRHQWVLVEQANGRLSAWEWRTGRLTSIAATGATRHAFSPSGHDLALAYEDELVLITGLPATPRVTLRRTLPFPPAVIAVSDGADQAALIDAEGAVYAANGERMANGVTALAFVPGTLDISVLDASRGELRLVRAAGEQILATGLEGASALWAGRDKFVVLGSAGVLWRITRESVSTEEMDPGSAVQETQFEGTLVVTGGEPQLYVWPYAAQRVYRLEGERR